MKRFTVLLITLISITTTASVVDAKKQLTSSAQETVTTAPQPQENAEYAHAPFEMGECDICHANSDPKNPGPITGGNINAVCFSCHENMQEAFSEGAFKYTHFAAEDNCTNCHNPHNSKYRYFLKQKAPDLCTSCHTDIKALMASTVQHNALTEQKSCLNCHDPHTSNVQHMLHQQPFDLCITCHNTDSLKDDQGKTLINFKELLEKNPIHHSPVAEKDCSACHQPHGSGNFRLLVESYPAKFYSPFDPKNYGLCFSCHDEEMVLKQNTTTLTNFRDGDRNLHYVHVNKTSMGRTCRACHEVHASPQHYQIRDGVPFGSKGWILKLNYQKEKNGGACSKTCHNTRTYNPKK